jgi:hypothetical protein
MPVRYSERFFDRVMIDHLVNPWFDGVVPFAMAFLMAALFAGWFFFRVNRSTPWGALVTSLGSIAVFMVLVLRDSPNPAKGAMVVVPCLFVLVVASLTALLSSLAVKRLPFLGIDEKYLWNTKAGLVLFRIPLTLGCIFFFLAWLLITEPFTFLGAVTGLGFIAGLAAVVIGGVLSGLIAMFLIPYQDVEDTTRIFFAEETPERELVDIFRVSGGAPPLERFAVPIIWVALVILVIFFSSSDEARADNGFGVALLVGLALSIMFTEFSRAKSRGLFQGGNEVPVETEKAKLLPQSGISGTPARAGGARGSLANVGAAPREEEVLN